jgi:hypothetical protein
MIGIVESVKEEMGVPLKTVCQELDVSYSNLMRWKRHQAHGEPVIGTPGPAKVVPLELESLKDEIRQLSHGEERTRGTGALYEKHREEISRRHLQTLVAAVRHEMNAQKEAEQRRVEWLMPGLVWSMDDAKLKRLLEAYGHVHVVHDLGSRYTLRSLGSRDLADGYTIAGSLEALFLEYGAPLFMKMDNGSNLNHHEVLRVLGEYGVTVLNSPAYYPPYNGAVEKKQRDLQGRLQARLGDEHVELRVFELETEVCGHELNHRPRASLKGATPCRIMQEGREAIRRFGRRKRREVYEQIKALTVDIIRKLRNDAVAVVGDKVIETAYRHAAEAWMQINNVIQVSRNGVVLPCSYQI